MNPHSLNAALRSAGAAVKAVDLVMSGEANRAFCNVRPPGHHAGRTSAAGFCIFNNVAVAAAYVLEHYGLQRVAIADFDVHHGNGTEEIFYNDVHVMLRSTFRHPYYPYCGADSGNNHIINDPLPLEVLAWSFVPLSVITGCLHWKNFNQSFFLSRQVSMPIGKMIWVGCL
jgi:acetoin utilization deacetylase AcuC-like enzyme